MKKISHNTPINKEIVFFRYQYRFFYGEEKPEIYVLEFYLVKETPKGFWITDEQFVRWIPKQSKARFAYPTLEEAKTNFIKRNELRVRILMNTAKTLNKVLLTAKKDFQK